MGAVAGSVAAKVSKIWNSGRIPVEIVNHLDGSLVSRDHIQRFLYAQPPHLKTFRLVQCHSRPCLLCSSGGLGFLCLLGSSEHTSLSEENGGPPSTNQPYSITFLTTDSDVPKVFVFCQWYCAILCCVHGVLLQHVLPVAKFY